MVQKVIQTQIQKLKNFLGFARFFAKKTFTSKAILGPILIGLKDFFSLPKKRKMSRYRVDYQMYKLRQMEDLIAKNNSHYFITGQRIDDVR